MPVGLGRQVFDAAHEPKQWYVVPGADHNDVPVVGGNPYFEKIDELCPDGGLQWPWTIPVNNVVPLDRRFDRWLRILFVSD